MTTRDGTARSAELDGFAPMQDEFVPQKGDFASLQDVLQDAFAPMEGDFAPLEDAPASMRGGAASLQDAFAPLQDAFTPMRGDFAPLEDNFEPLQGDTPTPPQSPLYYDAPLWVAQHDDDDEGDTEPDSPRGVPEEDKKAVPALLDAYGALVPENEGWSMFAPAPAPTAPTFAPVLTRTPTLVNM